MLNLLPLCLISSNPNDMNLFIPGPFLTLELLTSVPDEVVAMENINRLGRCRFSGSNKI